MKTLKKNQNKYLPDKAVQEFIEIYEKKYGERLSVNEGRIKAQSFFDLMKLITKPIKRKG